MDLDDASQQNPRCGEGKVLKLSIQQRTSKIIKEQKDTHIQSESIRHTHPGNHFYIFLYLFIQSLIWSSCLLARERKRPMRKLQDTREPQALGLWVAEARFLNQCFVHYDFTLGFLCIFLFVGCFLARANSLVWEIFTTLNDFDGFWMILASFGTSQLPQLPLSPQLTQTPLAWLWSHRSSSIKFLCDETSLASPNNTGELLWFGP